MCVCVCVVSDWRGGLEVVLIGEQLAVGTDFESKDDVPIR